ncbi:hypothetical protein [Streptomyces sp. NPDC087539]|uniref:hypothetical protein n=1 Tax=Streptomyces sp. NPDC087539 TaxID=3365798 RepID=UPI0037FE32AE
MTATVGTEVTVAQCAASAERVLDEVERVIVGKREALRPVPLGILGSGHLLLEDLSGLGKTPMARSFATLLRRRRDRRHPATGAGARHTSAPDDPGYDTREFAVKRARTATRSRPPRGRTGTCARASPADTLALDWKPAPLLRRLTTSAVPALVLTAVLGRAELVLVAVPLPRSLASADRAGPPTTWSRPGGSRHSGGGRPAVSADPPGARRGAPSGVHGVVPRVTRALRREQLTDNGLSVPCAWIAAMTKDGDIQQTPEGSAELWIGAVPSLGPGGRDVFLGLGSHADEPGARLARLLLDRGHEGEEGVFYLLPEDLAARYERTGDRLAVTLLARRDVLAHSLRGRPEEGLVLPGALPCDPLDADRVVLLRRELTTGFVPVEQDGEFQPVLLVDHAAGPDAGPEELIALFEEGEAGIAVLNAELLPDRA